MSIDVIIKPVFDQVITTIFHVTCPLYHLSKRVHQLACYFISVGSVI